MDADETTTPLLLLVVGQAGRDTALFAGVAERLGLHAPEPEQLRQVGELHERLLRRVAVQKLDGRPNAWASTGPLATRAGVREELRGWLAEQLKGQRRLVVHAPEASWLVALWREAARDLGLALAVATVLRHPAHAGGDDRSVVSGTAGWLNGVLGTERATRDLPRAFVHHDDLVDDWTRELSRVDAQLGTGLVAGAAVSGVRAADELVAAAEQAESAAARVPTPLHDLVERAWSLLEQLPAGDDAARRQLDDELDAVRRAYQDYYAECESVVLSSIEGQATSPRQQVQARNAQRAAQR